MNASEIPADVARVLAARLRNAASRSSVPGSLPVLFFGDLPTARTVICVKQSLVTARLELVILFRKEVSELQMGILPPTLSWGAGYSATHLNLAAQTVIDATGVPAGVALLVLQSRVIGHIAFHAERSRAEVIWISYEVSEPFQNQGYASEAVPALADELLTVASVVRAEVLRGRAASIKVLTRAGLTKTEDRGFGEIWERRATA